MYAGMLPMPGWVAGRDKKMYPTIVSLEQLRLRIVFSLIFS
jgi:hypothetical protein